MATIHRCLTVKLNNYKIKSNNGNSYQLKHMKYWKVKQN